MGLFGIGKKKEMKVKVKVTEKAENTCCCCGKGNVVEVKTCCSDEIKSIKVLGAGCKSCHDQYEYVKKAVEALGLAINVEYITDMGEVMTYGVIGMPAIVINEKVVVAGKVLKQAAVESLLKK